MKKSVTEIFSDSFELWSKNVGEYSKFLLYPYFGQVFGIVWILSITFYMAHYREQIAAYIPIIEYHSLNMFFVCIILSIPGFILLASAFWRSITVYIEIIRDVYQKITDNKLEDYKTYITKNNSDFAFLILILMGITLLAVLFVITIPLLIPFTVYSALVYTVFALNKEEKPFDNIKKSFSLISGYFWPSVGLLLLVWLFVNVASIIVTALVSYSDLSGFLGSKINMLTTNFFPAFEIKNLNFGKELVEHIFSSFVTFFMSPLGMIALTYWYIELKRRKDSV